MRNFPSDQVPHGAPWCPEATGDGWRSMVIPVEPGCVFHFCVVRVEQPESHPGLLQGWRRWEMHEARCFTWSQSPGCHWRCHWGSFMLLHGSHFVMRCSISSSESSFSWGSWISKCFISDYEKDVANGWHTQHPISFAVLHFAVFDVKQGTVSQNIQTFKYGLFTASVDHSKITDIKRWCKRCICTQAQKRLLIDTNCLHGCVYICMIT